MPYTPTVGPRPRDLNPEAFSPAANGFASQVEMTTIYDRPIPERTWNFMRHVGYVGFGTMLNSMGFGVGSKNPTTGHYETPWIEDTVTFGEIIEAPAAAGDDMVVELHTDTMFDTSMTSSGTGVQTSYPLENDVIEFYDRTQAFVAEKDVSVTPHQLTLTPLDSTVDLGDMVSIDEEYGISHNMHAEGSDLPQGRAPRIVKYSNSFAIVKHAFGSTGSELTNAVYFETIPGQEGSAGQSIYATIQKNALSRYERSKSNILLFGQTSDNITELVEDTQVDTPIVGTEGLIDFALANGNGDSYVPGTYTLEDFDTIAQFYYDERSTNGNDLICWDGPTLATETENVFTNVLVNNLAPMVDRLIDGFGDYMTEGYQESLDHGATDANLSFGYTCVKKNGFIFHLKRLSEFNDVKRLGSSNYAYSGYRLTMPVGWTRDRLSGNDRPIVGYEWKQMDDYSRENIFGDINGAGVGGFNTPHGRASNGHDTKRYYLISEMAGHWAVGNAIVTQIPEEA